MTNQQEQDPSAKEAFAASYLYAKEKLSLPEDEAVLFARTEAMRNRFFLEATQLRHNVSVRLLYFIPILLFLVFLIIGLASKTNWWFYIPALMTLAIWANTRKWVSFWIPLLYWIKPFVKKPIVAQNDIDPTDWRSYFSLPYPHGRANISQMINACVEEVHFFGTRLIIRSVVSTHIFYLGAFTVLAYFAWR